MGWNRIFHRLEIQQITVYFNENATVESHDQIGDTFHEFADQARTWCPWTRAGDRLLRNRGMKRHAAARKLARRWIRILYRAWKTRSPFDCDRYVETCSEDNEVQQITFGESQVAVKSAARSKKKADIPAFA